MALFQHPLAFALFLPLGACGGGGGGASTQSLTTPAAVPSPLFSYAGLTYQLENGGYFDGLSPTTSSQMPTSHTAEYTGISQGQIKEHIKTGTASASADFDAATITVNGSVNFDGAGGYGIIDFSQEADISGNQFSGQSAVNLDQNPSASPTVVEGAFYNSDGSVAAGTISTPVPYGEIFKGIFITKSK